jgi:hypothetical protein
MFASRSAHLIESLMLAGTTVKILPERDLIDPSGAQRIADAGLQVSLVPAISSATRARKDGIEDASARSSVPVQVDIHRDRVRNSGIGPQVASCIAAGSHNGRAQLRKPNSDYRAASSVIDSETTCTTRGLPRRLRRPQS